MASDIGRDRQSIKPARLTTCCSVLSYLSESSITLVAIGSLARLGRCLGRRRSGCTNHSQIGSATGS